MKRSISLFLGVAIISFEVFSSSAKATIADIKEIKIKNGKIEVTMLAESPNCQGIKKFSIDALNAENRDLTLDPAFNPEYRKFQNEYFSHAREILFDSFVEKNLLPARVNRSAVASPIVEQPVAINRQMSGDRSTKQIVQFKEGVTCVFAQDSYWQNMHNSVLTPNVTLRAVCKIGSGAQILAIPAEYGCDFDPLDAELDQALREKYLRKDQ